jgi:DNA-binding beta-propeller fold protein YncE
VTISLSLSLLVAGGASAKTSGIKALPLPVSPLTHSVGGADDFAVSPDGKTLYVAYFNGDAVLSVPRDAPRAAQPLPAVIDEPSGLAVSPDGKLLYVSSYTANAVYIVDLVPGPSYGTIVGTIDTGSYRLEETQGLAVSSAGVLYIADSQTEQILVADTTGDAHNDSVVGALSDPHGYLARPVDLALSPNGSTLYITTQKRGLAIANVGGGLTDPDSQTVAQAVTIGKGRDAGAYELTISANGKTLYVVPRVPETRVLALSARTHRVIETAQGFKNLVGLVFARGTLYSSDGGTVVSFPAADQRAIRPPWAAAPARLSAAGATHNQRSTGLRPGPVSFMLVPACAQLQFTRT